MSSDEPIITNWMVNPIVSMKQVAIYGKGGIGKSTISANISFQLSSAGLKVVQIGCDPKHDSTRLLLSGKTQRTILDHINSGDTDIGDAVYEGKNGVKCIETGGPEPGIGCAGRGILTAFNFIKSNNIIDSDADIVLYDVLGDVVCGGFAIPLRQKYADAVFIVTSGEFMSLYAANNVLRGIRNFDKGYRKRIAGLILNLRGNSGEYEYVKNFADAVKLPIVAKIPRSKRFAEAESSGMTVSEMFPDSDEYRALNEITRKIQDLLENGCELYTADPLNDEELDRVAKGLPVERKESEQKKKRDLSVKERDVLKGCATYTAILHCMGVAEADIIIHGPSSCHFFYASTVDADNLNAGLATEIRSVTDRIFTTAITDRSSIFGGVGRLREVLDERISAGSKTMFVISTCVPAIIGDDITGVCEEYESKYPECRIIPVEADGILNGGSYQGRDMAVKAVCRLTDRDIVPDSRSVNIVGYHDIADKAMMAADDTRRLLEGLGFRINCLFLNHNSLDEIRNLMKGSMDLMSVYSIFNRQICQVLERELGTPWFEKPMPIGLSETEEWIAEFSKKMEIPEKVYVPVIDSFRKDYEDFEKEFGNCLSGKKAILYCQTATDFRWLLEITGILGITITNIYCPTNSKWNNADELRLKELGISIETDVDFDVLKERIEVVKPDMVLGNILIVSQLELPHFNIRNIRTGVRSPIECGKRIIRLMKAYNI